MPRHRGALIKIILDNNIQKMAEVGVDWGRTSRKILKRCDRVLKEYWAIDHWEGEERDVTYEQVVTYMFSYPKLHVLKLSSVKAAKLVPKGYFDLVYIDANHIYDFVVEDIKSWISLVKKGGILAGHDYNKSSVRRAVNECLGEIVEPTPALGSKGSTKIWIKNIGRDLNGTY